MASYYCFDAATGSWTQETQSSFHSSLTGDIQRALNTAPLSLREIQAEEAAQGGVEGERKVAEQAAAAAKALADLKAWQEIKAHLDAGEKPCWLCKQDKGVIAFHKCKEDVCPTATNDYCIFYSDGSPNLAYKAHPYRASAGSRLSNNAIRSIQREHDAEEARIRRLTKEAKEAKAEFERYRDAPENSLAAYVVKEAPKKAKKEPKKSVVEKFSLDEI